MPALSEFLPTIVGVAILVAVSIVVLWAYGAPHRFAPALAIARGTVQLAILSFILSGVITDPWWVALALVVMFVVAAATAARRLRWSWRRFGLVSAAMALGILPTAAVVFSTGAIALTARFALAIGGIVIGNSMTIATLAGRRFVEATNDHWEEIEGWLALGATRRESTLQLARNAVYSALIPSTDQTKTTGLVALPGAFVGAIFGGLSPLEAGRFQIVVLASIMAAGSITAVILVAALAPIRRRPALLA